MQRPPLTRASDVRRVRQCTRRIFGQKGRLTFKMTTYAICRRKSVRQPGRCNAAKRAGTAGS
ncbi:hypothetical protein KCP75_08745 [Salmonella enterica subsp. enterica]|nr:hypothetical protein KCP75_08745 [Salmonella enterica subsp. enterica]